MDVDSVSGSERDDEDWEDVDEIPGDVKCGRWDTLPGTAEGRARAKEEVEEGTSRAKAREVVRLSGPQLFSVETV